MKRLWIMPVAGSVAGALMGAAAGPGVIGGETLIPVGAALAVVGVVYALGRRVKGWEDTLTEMARSQEGQKERVEELKRLIISRPCVKARDVCPGTGKGA